MGGTCTARAVPHFGALGAPRVLASLVCPRARALHPNEDVTASPTLPEQQLGRLVGHDGQSRLGIGRHAGWTARLSPYVGGFP